MMADAGVLLAPRSYGTNASYIYEFSRGLGGVNVPKDVLFTRVIYTSLCIVAFCFFCGRVAQLAHSKLRLLTSLVADRRQQAYWSIESSPLWAHVKKHVLYAPLGRKRHNREIQLSSAVNVGTVPSRFQALLITLYIASQFAYCTYLDYKVNTKAALLAELRGRSGTLAVVNLVPLFLLAARNNPLIPLLRISFDTYNLVHRWLGRIVVIESIVHTVAWAVNACDEQDVGKMLQRLHDTPFFTWGLVGTVAMAFLSLHSPSPIRHAFYETFLHFHRLAATVALIGVYMHLQIDSLPQKPWLNVTICMWAVEHGLRLLRLLWLNVGNKMMTKVTVQALPGEACCVTFRLPRRVSIPPGSHVYAYIPRISWWMSHPFSVAWAEDVSGSDHGVDAMDIEKLGSSLYIEEAAAASGHHRTTTTVTLIVTAHHGATRQLYDRARGSPENRFQASGLVEGPYRTGDPTILPSYGTAILFAAGAGITHHLLHVRELLVLASTERGATRQIHLIWSVRTTAHLIWARDFMNQILQLPSRRQILRIRLFISKPMNHRLVSSPSDTVTMTPGRCNPGIILDEILPGRVGAAAVSVCGPGSFADEVRAAARDRTGKGMMIDFIEEAFSW